MKKTILMVMFFSAAMLDARQVPPEWHTRERQYHVVHYKINLAVDLPGSSVTGFTSVTLTPLRPGTDTVCLDAGPMSISRITLNDSPLGFRQDDDSLVIALPRPFGDRDTLTLTVYYTVASPQRGLYFIHPDSSLPDRDLQAWTQGEARDNHYWFPCYDDPNDLSTSETILTVDDAYTAVSNGLLIDRRKDARHHTATFHWLEAKPHVSYLVSFAVGKYEMVPDTAGGLPIENYVYPSQVNDAMRSFGNTPAMIEYFAEKIGYPFPWEKYGHVVIRDFMFGGEENVSISTLTDHTIHDERAQLDNSSDPLVAHELAHQWWGDLVSFRDWSHAWLSEGFATYFELLFEEHSLGRDHAAKSRHDAQMIVVNSDRYDHRRPTVCPRYNAPMELFDSRIYQKGACVLHMLRFVLGDELFWKSINRYVTTHAFRNAETNDLKIAIEEATGYNLDWFFDEWLYHAGYPEFDIEQKWNQGSRSVTVTVTQKQVVDSLTPVFRTPVDIQVWVQDRPETYRVMIGQKSESFTFPAYQKPDLVLFDKGCQVLKKVNFPRTTAELLYQLQNAEDGIDRLLAIDELQWTADSPEVRRVLEKVMLDDPYGEVRRDAVWAIGDVKSADESEHLLRAYGDLESRVRVASVASLGKFRGENIVSTLRHAFEKDPSYAVAAAAFRSLMLADTANRSMYLHEALQRSSYDEEIRSAALQEIGTRRTDSSLTVLMSYTGEIHNRNLRIQALRSLGSGWGQREDIVQYIARGLEDRNYSVKRAVIEIFSTLDSPVAERELNRFLTTETDVRLIEAAKEARVKIEETIKKKASH
ncbi:MAG TPA: M1 family aminopeptidase [Bacteroidota bacterium]|nr:M1 family aminopeptidase [Bacteroidota bacterium]